MILFRRVCTDPRVPPLGSTTNYLCDTFSNDFQWQLVRLLDGTTTCRPRSRFKRPWLWFFLQSVTSGTSTTTTTSGLDRRRLPTHFFCLLSVLTLNKLKRGKNRLEDRKGDSLVMDLGQSLLSTHNKSPMVGESHVSRVLNDTGDIICL